MAVVGTRVGLGSCHGLLDSRGAARNADVPTLKASVLADDRTQ